ncbi:MAG: hypothetical protein GC200_05155 [Tepidisphaera sp.]|nr:hypothetical protein [Tepidisphaera sp.]
MAHTPKYREQPGNLNSDGTRTPSRGFSDFPTIKPDGTSGYKRFYFPGQHNSTESREAYHRALAEWEGQGRKAPVKSAAAASGATGPSIAEVLRDYWRHVQTEHVNSTSAQEHVRQAVRPLNRLFGTTPAAGFTLSNLETVRAEFIKAGNCRTTINGRIQILVSMFKWAAARGLVPKSVRDDVRDIEPIKRGRYGVREGRKVRPVSRELVEAVRPFLSRQVAAMIDLQLLTGARPGEVVGVRWCDLDTSEPVWSARLSEHKNAHRGMERVLFLNAEAQSLLSRFRFGKADNDPLFSPRDAERERYAKCDTHRHQAVPGAKTARTLRPCYGVDEYRKAIWRACDQAFLAQGDIAKREGESEAAYLARLNPAQRTELKAWRKRHRWAPNQLRHTSLTEMARTHGEEFARIMGGHAPGSRVTCAVYVDPNVEGVKRTLAAQAS